MDSDLNLNVELKLDLKLNVGVAVQGQGLWSLLIRKFDQVVLLSIRDLRSVP